ncbi:benzyl alcohol O-benzoyltransferase [Brachypodium distachyon]|uniref:Uncharacterized protein n=1 Tax=Brachypodium distachyon TaxID=15368 RepID=I1IAQ6_BRADI|nr:benzyl alcohol O-benzoyltransferase [Brachypodium distachyon]KQJ99965.1 hypothetical protein BRADI_3g46350v3 [Brachypodium distachyon]|eukprot:XP_003575185.1 benzyl alcohol O-benzoyltransferase [Brachypodium distachyon]
MASSLRAFAVRRGEPVLVIPAAPTPREVKPLSDIDDGEGMRFYSSGIHLYRRNPSKQNTDPARVIREALARALVPYYPLAGRLREEAGRKLVVDCGAQGVMFAEADADLTADDFGDLRFCPPFPCFEHFILESTTNAGAEPVIGRPLLYFQVTRLRCGGFVFGHRVCHCMADAPGGMQFQKAIGELARGADAPPVAPAWGREMFMARQPPQPCYPHLEYVEPPATGAKPDRMLSTPPDAMSRVHFFFGPKEIAGLRQRAPRNMSCCSRFELVAAGIWRSRTAALGYPADEEVRLSIIVNARGRGVVPLPEGFYGNAFAYSAAATTAGELCRDRGGLGHALELVKKAKAAVTGEYLQSVADLMVLAGRPLFALSRTYIVSDVSHAGFKGVDLGWGEAVYGGPAKGGEGPFPGVANYFSRSKNGKGEEGILVPVCLPEDAMDKFQLQIQGLTSEL